LRSVSSYDKLEDLGRVRLSRNFFMREFLHSEIAAWHGLQNIPVDPDRAVALGRSLCEQLLEPLQEAFGRVHIRSGYRAPTVNEFGNSNRLNCASNESNYAGHIWDHPDQSGKFGATACIVLPWLVDHVERGGSWTDMAWWIHDHLPYNTLHFFPKLVAFNINWHEAPERRIDSYIEPKGCLTRSGMANHTGSHIEGYCGFPAGPAVPLITPIDVLQVQPIHPQAQPRRPGSGPVRYRAVHVKTAWRKVNSHRTIDAAIHGRDGAAGLFAGKVRIDYETHGEPLYVLAWEDSAQSGFAVKRDAGAPNGVRVAIVSADVIAKFEAAGGADASALEQLFSKA
jgi:hypothetical protein